MLVLLSLLAMFFCGCESQQAADAPASTSASASDSASVSDSDSASGHEESDLRRQTSFLFFSDTQASPETGDYSGFGEMLATAVTKAENPDLVIFGGDTVNDGGDADEWRAFWEAAAQPLSGLVTAAIPGNHDNYPLLAKQFDYPDKAPAGQGEGYFYSFDTGPVHFIMLDSNIMGAGNERDVEWLRNDLESAEAQQSVWRIAVMHHPMWPVVDNPKDAARAETMRELFLPLLADYGTDLILCGHQHVYARTLPMSGDTAAPDGVGIIQIMAASGSKEAYTAGAFEYISASAGAPNYLCITADDDVLSVIAFNAGGEPFDVVTIMR